MTRAPVPDRPTLPKLREAVQECRACELWAGATQAVPGEGTSRAQVMFVGEQPGDREDREGVPFTGPAGALFDRALEEAGIDRKSAYVTNAVKHFRFQERGKRRIHQRPDASQSPPAGPGSMPRSRSYGRESWSASARPPRRR
jgi:uracil-DNA glycosylase